MKDDYALFYEYYYALYDYVKANKFPVDEKTLQDFFHADDFYRLSNDAQSFAKRFAENSISVNNLLLDATEAHDWYVFFYKQNFPDGYPFNQANEEFIEGEYELKDFSPVIGPLGHQPLHSGILRKRVNEKYLIFPYFKNQKELSHLILAPIVNKLIKGNKLTARKAIGFVQLFGFEASGAGWDPLAIKEEVEVLLRGQLAAAEKPSDIKKIWMQLILASFRYEKQPSSYIQWQCFKYPETVQKLENFTAVLDEKPELQLPEEEAALLKWIRFVVFRSNGLHPLAKKEAHDLLEKEELVLGATRQPLYSKLEIVPINDTYKNLVIRKLDIDFRDILVSYLLDYYITEGKYEAAFFLLQQSDPYFKEFIPKYYRSAGRNEWLAEDESLSAENLFKEQIQRVHIVLGDNWIANFHKEIEREAAVGKSVKRDSFEWLLRYIHNVRSIFSEMQEVELAGQINEFYSQLRSVE